MVGPSQIQHGLQLFPRLARLPGRIRRSPAGTLVLSSGAAQLVTVGSAPLLTRLYSPEAFGWLELYAASVAMCGVVGALRYDSAITLPRTASRARDVLRLCLGLLLVTACCVAIVMMVGAGRFLPVAGRWGPHSWLMLIPLGIVSAGSYQCFSIWRVRHGDFRELSRARFATSSTQVSAQIMAGLAQAGAGGLILSAWLAQVLGCVILARTPTLRGLLGHVSWRRVKTAASEYRRFPLLSAPAVLINSVGQRAPSLLLAGLFGLQVAGLYAVASRLLLLPVSLISNAVAQVYLSQGSRLMHEDPVEVRRLFLRTLANLTMISLAIFPIIAVFAPLMCGWVLGEKWAAAGDYIRILSGMCAIQFVASPLTRTLDFTQRQDLHLYRELGRLAALASVVGSAFALKLSSLPTVGLICAAVSLASLAGLASSWMALSQRSRMPAGN